MTDSADEAQERARIAGEQGKHAAKNAGRAAKAGAEAAAENATDKVEAAAEEAVSMARRLGYAGPELALAAFGLVVTVYSGRNALAKFRAYPGR